MTAGREERRPPPGARSARGPGAAAASAARGLTVPCAAPGLGSARRSGWRARGCWRASPASARAPAGKGPGCAPSRAAAAITAGPRGRGPSAQLAPAPAPRGGFPRIFQPPPPPSCGRVPVDAEGQPRASPGRIPGLTAGEPRSGRGRGPWGAAPGRGGAAPRGAAPGRAEPAAPPAARVTQPCSPRGDRPWPRGSRVPAQVIAGAGRAVEGKQCPGGGGPESPRAGWEKEVNRRKIQESLGWLCFGHISSPASKAWAWRRFR